MTSPLPLSLSLSTLCIAGTYSTTLAGGAWSVGWTQTTVRQQKKHGILPFYRSTPLPPCIFYETVIIDSL